MTEKDYLKSKEGFKKINDLDLSLEDSYFKIYNLLVEYVHIIIPSVIVLRNLPLFRCRIIENCHFSFKSDISYKPSSSSISYGRANHLNQSVFYASHTKESALFESSRVAKNKKTGIKEGITMGKWIVKEPFRVAAMINDPILLDRNNEAFKFYHNFLQEYPEYKETKTQEIMHMISDYFAIEGDGQNDYHYKISSALFNRIVQLSYEIGNPVNGILFPSIGYFKKDVNIAIHPDIVDNCLILQSIWNYEVENKNDGLLFNQIGTCDIQSFKMTNI